MKDKFKTLDKIDKILVELDDRIEKISVEVDDLRALLT